MFQHIADINDEHVEIMDNVYFKNIRRERWSEYYDEHLRRARAASNTPGKGSFVPEYLGIKHIDPDHIHALKYGRRGPRPGY